MTRRRLFRWSLILVILAAFAVWLEPTRVVWGWLRGEAYYQGRPASYWSEEVARWHPAPVKGFHAMTVDFYYENTSFERLLSRFIPLPEHTWPELLDGDPTAQPVLMEMMRDGRSAVRDLAAEGLNRIHTNERGPHKVNRTR